MRALISLLAVMLSLRSAAADDTRSPGLALGLSIGSTVAGGLVFGALAADSEEPPAHVLVPAGLMMLTGPSWGHVYSGDLDLAVGGTLLRVVGMAMIAEGMGDCVPDPSPTASLDDCVYVNEQRGLAIAGSILVVGTAVAEIIDAPLAVRRYNREHAFTVTPTLVGDRFGAALTGRF